MVNRFSCSTPATGNAAGFAKAVPMRVLFNVIDGNTEIAIVRLEGEQAETAMDKLLSLYTSEQIEEKLASCAWDYVEGPDFIALSVYC